MALPTFPTLKPKLIDPLWFNVDQPCDDESEIAQLEEEHQNWLNSIAQKHSEVAPIGKTVSENMEDEEDDDEEEEDNDDDEGTDSHDDEDEEDIEMDGSFDRNLPTNISVRMVQGHGVR